jgi:hypothetical protein
MAAGGGILHVVRLPETAGILLDLPLFLIHFTRILNTALISVQ